MGSQIHVNIPVLVGHNYEHVMCRAVIEEEGDTVTVTMTATGKNAVELQHLMTTGELMALSFVAIPVIPRSTDSKEKH